MCKKEYIFCKIRNIGDKENEGSWYLKPENQDDVTEHWLKYVKPYLSEGVREVCDKVINGKDIEYTNSFAIVVEMSKNISGKPLYEVVQELQMDMLRNRLKDIDDGEEIYLDKTATVLLLRSNKCEIVETVVKDKMKFPDEEKLCIDDVRYMQWTGGFHWYAKVGSRDVVDSEGNQKWSNKSDAIDAANWFITNEY